MTAQDEAVWDAIFGGPRTRPALRTAERATKRRPVAAPRPRPAEKPSLPRGRWLLYLTVAAAFVPLPGGLPRSLPLAGHGVQYYELLLAAAAGYMAATARTSSLGRALTWIGGLFLAAEIVSGLAHHVARDALIADSRSMVSLWLAFVVASRLPFSELGPLVLRAFKVALWAGAALNVLAVVGVLRVTGRDEAAGLFIDGSAGATNGATRLINNATHISLAVVCACVALLISGRVGIRTVWPYLLPALAPVFVSYSRNSVLAVGVVVLFVLLVEHDLAVIGRFGRLVAVAAAAVGVVLLVSGSSGLGDALHSYADRVIAGLSSSTMNADASSQYRVLENTYLLQTWHQAPLFGHGFGAVYRPASGSTGSFAATYATFYAHNFYYWLLVKAGVVGAAAWCLFAFGPVLTRISRPATLRMAAAGAGVGLLAASVVAPMPLGTDSASCVALGAALGLAAGTVRPRSEPRRGSPRRRRTSSASTAARR